MTSRSSMNSRDSASSSKNSQSGSASRAQSYNSQASSSASRGQSSAASQASNSASRAQSYNSQASRAAYRGQSTDSRAQSYDSQASNSVSRASNSASRGPSSASQASNSASRGQSSQASNIKYGELSVLGHSDSSTKSHFTLYKRPKANGVKPSTVHKGSDKSTNICGQSSMTFVTPVTTVIVEYAEDRNTDMFQIGRSTGDEIDYVLADTVSDTISRFACRIICQRSPPYTAHIYAAGFDSDKNIFLGPDAVKWESHGQMDGLTTNGVLVMQPLPGFTPGLWREISVCGSVLTPRDSPNSKTKGKKVGSEQELVDGTLIDLCGVTLLWRTTERPIQNLGAMLKNLPRH